MEKAAENTQTKNRKTGSIFEFLKAEVNVERPKWDDEPEAGTSHTSICPKTEQTGTIETKETETQVMSQKCILVLKR